MSSFFDKAKNAAQQAIDEARKGLDQGQAKLDEYQSRRQTEQLLTDLGAAYYAEQRWGGDHGPVDQALSAVDEHVRTVGLVGFPDSAVTPGATATGASESTQPSPPPDDPATGPAAT